ncbi:MAG: hypothetical protein FJZ01_09490 [Candidatus Sericytochromatia bacterium]|nr:hypothetical protein [Candidatus Tanganyikabacteria bacterium]
MSNRETQPLEGELSGDRQKAEIVRMEKQLKATTRELKLRLDYLDQLAKEHEAELNRLRAEPPSPQRDARIRRIDQKLGFYVAVKSAANGAEQVGAARVVPNPEARPGTQGQRVTVQDVFSMKMIEAQSIVAGARLVIDELLPRMKVVGGVLGKPAQYSPAELTMVNKVKARAKASPALMQRLQMIFQQFTDATTALVNAEKQFEQLKHLSGREALQFLTGTIKAPQLSGKLYHLERLHVEYAGDPDLSKLFPAPQPVNYPALSAEQPAEQKAKPRGGLMSLFGLNKK